MCRLFITLRNLFKNRTTSVITIAGFSVSISMALILIAFLINEFSIDKGYPNLDSIYRVFINDNTASVREEFRDQFVEAYPAIEDACRYNNYTSTVTSENKPFDGRMIVTDASFFNIFSVHFISGSLLTAFSNPNNVVLTKSFAGRIFGKDDPMGKILVAEYKTPLTVSAVVEDLPLNSSIRGDFFTDSRIKIRWEGASDGKGNNLALFRLFILTNKNTDIKGLEEKLTADFSQIKYNIGGDINNISLMPFRSSYFMQVTNNTQTQHANIKLISLLVIITSAIILLAVFNFLNLSTASHTDRYKEIAIRKTIGASRMKIFIQFILESVIICFVSAGIAIMLLSLWLPFFERFLGETVNLSVLFSPMVLIRLSLGIAVIAVIAGIYPALVVSRLRPISIITKKEHKNRGSINLRASLNIMQYSVSIILIIALIVISRQINYVRATDYGYDTEKLLRVDVHWRLAESKSLIRDELLQEPSIKSVCFSHGTPGSIYMRSTWETDDRELMIDVLTVDTSFFNVFHIPLISGRDFMSSEVNNVCYINETALKTSGWESYLGHECNGMEIIGVVRDFNFANMHNRIGPLTIAVSDRFSVSHLTLRVDQGNLTRTIDALKKTWKEACAGYELKYQFYDEWLDSMYKGEEKLAAAVSLFAVLAILISCLGIFGLAEFSIKKRTKEIGLRKVSGARVSQVIALLNFYFVRWVIYSVFIAAPVSYFILKKWLAGFAYKAPLSWWIFVAGGLIAVIIATITISWQSWRAATSNPVEALRYE